MLTNVNLFNSNCGGAKLPDELLIDQCSPTMAGLKTGNLFSYRYDDKEELNESMREFNRKFSSKGVRLLPLKADGGHALVYMYRPKKLEEDLKDKKACEILSDCSYCTENAGRCVARLARRLRSCSEFPHEIGLFLGYPSEDVDGFIKNKAACSKCVGTWKVYGDENEAKRKFSQFRKCSAVYKAAYNKHKSFEKLIVGIQK